MNERYTFADFICQYQQCVHHSMYDLLDVVHDLRQARRQSEYYSRLNLLKCLADSMTSLEKARPEILNPSRCRRIARGSGIPWTLQGELLEEYFQARAWHEKMNTMSIQEKMLFISEHIGPGAQYGSDDLDK